MFWGIQDSSVNFCEDKYVNSTYIAEYNNTLSCIFYLVPAILYRKTKIHNISTCLFFLAIGSAILHATLRFYGQWLDEIAMLCLSYMTIKEFRPNIPNDFLILAVILYLYFWNTFCIFFIMFTIMQLIIVHDAKNHINNRNRIYIYLYIVSFSLGSICWFLDQFACSYFKVYNLHAWWHFFTGMSMTSGYYVLL
jgi:dihydroceramidase